MNRMTANALRALNQLLEVRAGERLLIVTDRETSAVAESWEKAARKIGAEVAVFEIPDELRPLETIPDKLASMIPGTAVAITAFRSDASETPFRVALLGELSRHVRRLGHSPGITESMMVEGGMEADYQKMDMVARDLMRRLEGAVSARVTSPAGTDITLNISQRPFSSDTAIADGTFGNLPCGEVWCAPVEDSAEGVVACDGSIGDLGQVPAPVRITVAAGRVVSVTCSDAAFLARVEGLLAVDAQASVIGELGIGINPAARITGNLLEDEKAGGTAHIAFGNNAGMPGGRNKSRTHRDFLFHEPTISFCFDDGREETLVVSGRITRERRPRRSGDAGTWTDILVPVDFDESSEEAVIVADRIARQNRARLIFCHVINRAVPVNVMYPTLSAMHTSADVVKAEEAESIRRLAGMVDHLTHRAPDQYEMLVFAGDPVRSILECAEQQAVDLIVVPADVDRGGTRRFLGVVFKSVAENAGCDVLVVR